MALIEIGSARQLFIDTYLIESLKDTRLVLNPAEKVDENPILRPELPWEGKDVSVGHVIFDAHEQRFRMWYSARTFAGQRNAQGIVVTGEEDAVICYATSDDGIRWEKPALGLVDYQGSKANNIVPAETFMPYFFQDTHDPDPNRRYKGLIRHGTTQTPGMQFDLYFSADAFHWTPYQHNPIINTAPQVGRWGPTNFMGWDPIRQVYAVHMENCLHRRCPQGKRMIGRAESPDMIHWTEPETIIVPDADDYPDTEFYAMPVIAYEGLYVGLLWNFRTTQTTILPQIVFSRDGIRYNRQYREPFIARGAPRDFDGAVVYVEEPIVHNDRILTYYTGRNWRSPETLVARGEKALGAIGLAITPRDGFVSLDGAKGAATDVTADRPDTAAYSQMTTRAFGFSGAQLHLNMAAALQQWGAGPCDVRVEILSPNHHPLPGFGMADADPITTTGAAHVVSWRGQSNLSHLAGEAIRLRFWFKNARLYAFQFK